MYRTVLVLALALITVFPRAGSADPLLMTSDFIPDAVRTGFAGFETAPLVAPYETLLTSFFDGGIIVDAIGGGFFTNCSPANAGQDACTAVEGMRSLAQLGDDSLQARIRQDGGDLFGDVQMRVSTHWSPNPAVRWLNYDVRLGGVTQLAGRLAFPTDALQYVGFSGGGFDEILLSATLGDGVRNYIQIDSIELASPAAATPVPEPASMLLLSSGLTGVAWARRRRRQARN